MGIALLAVAGLLLGGAWSSYQQGRSKATIAIFVALAALATVAGVLWL